MIFSHAAGDGSGFFADRLFGANLHTVAAVRGLQEVNITASESKYALDRCGDILMQPIGKFDDHDSPNSRRLKKPAKDCASWGTAHFTEHHVHALKVAQGGRRAK